jgi:hypothetical protein
LTLAQYYKGFWSVLGVLAAAPPLLVGIIIPVLTPATPVYGFPPIGDATSLARVGLVCLSFLVTFIVYFWKGRRWPLFLAFLLAFAALSVYVALYSHFVMRIDVPPQDSVIRVSVGYERTQFGQSNFAHDSDEDMLRARGTSDEEIKKLWTYKSLSIARLSLFVSYCCFIFGLVGAFSLGVLFDIRDRLSAGNPQANSNLPPVTQ